VEISGADTDFHCRDLWEAIDAGEYPVWELGLQIFTEEQAENSVSTSSTPPQSFRKSRCRCGVGGHAAAGCSLICRKIRKG